MDNETFFAGILGLVMLAAAGLALTSAVCWELPVKEPGPVRPLVPFYSTGDDGSL